MRDLWRNRYLFAGLWLIVAALIGVGLWTARNAPPSPLTIEETVGGSSVRITQDSTHVFRAADCTTLHWQADNIATIMFNEVATVGEDTRELCGGTVNRLRVTFPDGSFRQYILTTSVSALSGRYLTALFIALLSALIGAALLAEPLLPPSTHALGRVPALGWLAGGLALLVGLAAWSLIPAPAEVRDGNAERGAYLRVDDARHFWARGCYTVAWEVNGVERVALNDAGQVGEGETELCPLSTEPPALSVTYADGEAVTYSVPVRYLLVDGLFWAWALVGAGLLWMGVYGLWGDMLRRTGAAFSWGVEGLSVGALLMFVALASTWQAASGRVMLDGLVRVLGLSVPLALVGWALIRARASAAPSPRTHAERVRDALMLWPLLPLIAGGLSLVLIPEQFYGGDGIVHSSIAYAVRNGGIPPENPYLAGRILNFYWMYNALVATIGAALGTVPAWGAVIVHTLTLAMTLTAGAALVRHTHGDDLRGLTWGAGILFVLFGYNVLGGFFYIVNGWLADADTLLFLHSLPMGTFSTAFAWSILTYQGYPVGTMMVIVSLLGLAMLYRDGVSVRALFLAGGGVIGAVAYHAQSALIFLLTVVIAFALTMITPRVVSAETFTARWSGFWRRVWTAARERPAAVATGIGLLVTFTLPVLLHILSATAGNGGGLVGLQRESMKIAWGLLPVVPFFLRGFRRGLLRQDDWLVFAGWGAITVFVLGFTLYLGGLQFEKFHVQGGIWFYLVAFGGVLDALRNTDTNALARLWRATARLALALAVVNVAVVAYLSDGQANGFNINDDAHITYRGTQTLDLDDPYQPVCDWMLADTPTDAVIVNQLSSIYQPGAMLCQRSLFLGDTNHMTELDPEYLPRVELVRTIFGNFADTDARLDALRTFGSYNGLEGRMLLLVIDGNPREQIAPHIPPERILLDDAAFMVVRLDGAWE